MPAVDEVALLERIIKIADAALAPSVQVCVPSSTFEALGDEVAIEAAKPSAPDERIIGQECVLLLQTLRTRAEYRESGDRDRAMRWEMIAKCFLPFLRTDLARAQAGMMILR